MESQLPTLFTRDLDPGSPLREAVERQIREGLTMVPFHHLEPPSEAAAVEALTARSPFDRHRLLWRHGLIFLPLLCLLVCSWLPEFLPGKPVEISKPPPFDGSAKNLADLEVAHAAEPGNPVIYQALVQTRFSRGLQLPEDFDAWWHSHEPDNAFWPAFKAGVLAKRDEDENKSFAALLEASQLSQWIDRSREMRDQGRSAYHQPDTLSECWEIERQMWNNDLKEPPTAFPMVHHRIATLLKNERPAELEELLSTWEKVMRLALRQPGLEHPPGAVSANGNLGRLGYDLNQCLRRYPELSSVIGRLKDLDKQGGYFGPGFPSVLPKNFALRPETAFADYVRALVPAHPDEFYHNRRLAEYALADRIALRWIATGTLLLLAALMTIGWMAGKGRLVTAAESLFRPRDTLRLVLAGAVTPIVWWVVIVQFTPLGGHGWGRSIWENRFLPHHALWLLSVASLPLFAFALLRALVQGEMARRAWFLPPPSSPRQRIASWLIAAAVAASVAVPGLVPASSYGQGPLVVMAFSGWMLLLLACLLWTLGMKAVKCRTSFSGLLAASQRWIAPLAVFCLLLLLTELGLRPVERDLVRNDPLSPMAPAEIRLLERDEDARAAYLREHLGGS